MSYEQPHLDALVALAKRVSDPPRREMKLEFGHSRNDFRLQSCDGNHQFQAFFRRNETLKENFSLGLDYLPVDGVRFPLLRVNGSHGENNRSFDPDHPHTHFHIHYMVAADLEAGILRARKATISRDYASFEQAVLYFLQLVNVTEGVEHFERYSQMELPLREPESAP